MWVRVQGVGWSYGNVLAGEAGGFGPCKGLSLMTSVWQLGLDQSMNSGSGRVSGFSTFFAKWDVSIGVGQGERGKGDAGRQADQAGKKGGNDFMTAGC